MATALMGSQTSGRGQWPGLRRSRETARPRLLARCPRPRISAGERERLLAAHLPQVRSIAFHLGRRLPPQVDVEDLFHAGVVGLIEAVEHFDPRKSRQFPAFAGFRIRGAILDSLREMDWGPRRLRRCGRQLEGVKEHLRRKLGRPPEEWEMARAVALGMEKYRRLTAELCGLGLESLDERLAPGLPNSPEPRAETSDPFEQCLRAEIGAIVASAAAGLDERERRVLRLYYAEELTMKEIASVLGIAESRVCQIHAGALGKVRARLAWRKCPARIRRGDLHPSTLPDGTGVVSHDQRCPLQT